MSGCREAVGHSSGGGAAQSEVPDTAGAVWGSPCLRRGSYALGHPGVAGCCGRAENDMETPLTGSSLGQRGEVGELWLVPWGCRGSLWLGCGRLVLAWCGGSCGWEYREAFCGRLDCISIGEDLHGSPRQN